MLRNQKKPDLFHERQLNDNRIAIPRHLERLCGDRLSLESIAKPRVQSHVPATLPSLRGRCGI